MNVLFISELSELGGGETSLFNTICEFKTNNKNIEAILLCYSEGQLTDIVREIDVKTIVYNFKYDVKKLRLMSTFKEIKNIIVKNEIEIVHSNEVIPALIVGAINTFYKLNCKIIWTCHGQWYKFNYIKKILIDKYLYKIISVSKAVKNNLMKNGVKESIIDVIPLSIDVNRFKNGNGNKIRDEFSIEENDMVFGTIGRFQEIKGQKLIVEACKLLKDENINIKFLMVGDAIFLNEKDIAYKKEVSELIEKYNLTDNIILLGKRNDIPNIMKALNALIIPSINESFGMVVIEAFAAECCVITTPCDGPKELINNKVNGIVLQNRNAKELKDAIKNFILDKGLRVNIKENLKKEKNKYDIETMCLKYEELYRSTL